MHAVTPPLAKPLPLPTLSAAFAEFVRHPPARLLVFQTIGAVVIRLAMGRLRWRDARVVVAMALYWPLQEWLVHKYLLHAPPRQFAGRTIDPVAARHHRAHHADPWNARLTVLPMWVIGPALPLQLLGWFLFMPTRRLAMSGMAVGSAATLAYEWVHFLTHVGYKPRRGWYRWLQRRHRLHHFKDEHLWLGVTSPWIDNLLGTAPDPRTVPTSPTVRTLGVVNDAEVSPAA
jgi:hypothetical protein